MAVRVYKDENLLNMKLHFQWKSISDKIMQLVDMGSRGPWLDFDNFTLDLETIKEVKSRKVNLDSSASFHNCVVERYISAGFQVESEGTNFFMRNF